MDKKEHWEKVYEIKSQQELSWYQPTPIQSINFFESFNLPKDAKIIDIGAGDSYFVDYLLDNQFTNIYVLDISENAIKRAKNRLGKRAEKVHWIVTDVVDFEPKVKFDFWHDRATFHFLTQNSQIERYLSRANESLSNGRFLVVGTFSESGPLKCSGLEIKQYSHENLEKRFSEYFQKISCTEEIHVTPFNTQQHFTFCSFKKQL